MGINFHLAKSFKIHLLIATLLACWVVLFLILLAPFDVSDLQIWLRWLLLPFYGILLIIAYLISLPLQNWLFKRRNNQWQLEDELCFISLFLVFSFILCFAYYRSGTLNGTQSLMEFLLYQFIPISVVMLPMVVFLRWTAGRLSQKEKAPNPLEAKITLEGATKKDVIRLNFQQITYVKAADNYVEIYYFEAQQLHMKLLRSTLKKINIKAPKLLRTHRSYLINPAHFQQWVSPNSIRIHQTEIPISKTYKANIEKQLSFATDQA